MPTIKIYSKEQVDALIASAGGLPDPTSASAGDVLTLDDNKSPGWSAVPDELPATTSASAGDVLTLDSNKDPAWVAPSGGGGTKVTITSQAELIAFMNSANDGDELYGTLMYISGSASANVVSQITMFDLKVHWQPTPSPGAKHVCGVVKTVKGFGVTTTHTTPSFEATWNSNGSFTINSLYLMWWLSNTMNFELKTNCTFTPTEFTEVTGIHY